MAHSHRRLPLPLGPVRPAAAGNAFGYDHQLHLARAAVGRPGDARQWLLGSHPRERPLFDRRPARPPPCGTAGSPTAVTVANGVTTSKDFCIDGVPQYAFVAAAVDDTSGNGNGIKPRR